MVVNIPHLKGERKKENFDLFKDIHKNEILPIGARFHVNPIMNIISLDHNKLSHIVIACIERGNKLFHKLSKSKIIGIDDNLIENPKVLRVKDVRKFVFPFSLGYMWFNDF